LDVDYVDYYKEIAKEVDANGFPQFKIIFATIALLVTGSRIGEARGQHLCKFYL